LVPSEASLLLCESISYPPQLPTPLGFRLLHGSPGVFTCLLSPSYFAILFLAVSTARYSDMLGFSSHYLYGSLVNNGNPPFCRLSHCRSALDPIGLPSILSPFCLESPLSLTVSRRLLPCRGLFIIVSRPRRSPPPPPTYILPGQSARGELTMVARLGMGCCVPRTVRAL
jgi:hypothetical protein